MKIERAIEILEKRPDNSDSLEGYYATKLGIEALKRIKEQHRYSLLPGETK